MDEENENFKNNHAYLETPRENAPRIVRKFIGKHAPEIEKRGYKLLTEFTKPNDSNQNHHVVYISENRETTVELSYQRLNLPTRFLMGLCLSPLSIKPNILVLAAESNFSNGEAVFTAAMDEAPMAKWIHSTFLDKDTDVKRLLEAHETKLSEIKSKIGLAPTQIKSVQQFQDKEAKQRERLAGLMEMEFEELVRENNVEWLVDEKDKHL
jgi:hypothetical protein